ncbi:group II intron reverse transcriptase/maturase [Escherichia coli]|nr:group II intron reverse transcriptase/maturase [Escherichia coli]
MLAYQRVVELKPSLKKNRPSVRQALTDGNYQPRAIRRMDIPKPDGGVRTLGIPTVLDRLIQQAIAQQLSAIVDKSFSDSSYGFRPGRSAWQAVQQAQRYIRSGKWWVVDMDLEKFFDRVAHRLLMTRLARTIKDRRVLRLIRRYLKSEMVKDGQREKRQEGMPQGGPLSPLLSNILLDELDKELERRGHSFCRYADDCNIYVSSRKAGEHLLDEIRGFVENKLKLKVNEKKSAVARPWERRFLGYSVTWHKQAKLKIALTSVNRLKEKVRSLTTGSSLMFYEQFGYLKFKYRNRAFWCRGYYVDTVGKNSRIFLNEYKPQMVKQTSPPRISVACIAREHAVVIKTGVIG